MKKLWVLLFVLLVAVAGFVGAQKKATIVFYTPSWGDSFIKEIAAKYAAERPNVQIDIIPGPSIWEEHVTKSQLWMNTKYKGVDIEYQDDVFAQDGAALGVWEDLWPFMSQAQKEDLTDVQLAYKKLFGGMYRIPWWQGMSYTFYNKKIFKEAGLSVPTTWAQLSSTAAKLTRDLDGDGQTDQYGYLAAGAEGPLAHSFWEFLYQAGGEEWKLAPGGKPDPKAKQALGFMTELFQKYAPKDLPAIHYDQGRAYLNENKAAMLRDWADYGMLAAKENRHEQIGVMNFPAGPAGPWGVAHGWGVVVNKYGANVKKNKKEVVDFALFMMKPEIHKLTAVLELPALKSVYKDAAFMEQLGKANLVSSVAPDWWKWRKPRQFPPKHGAEYMNGIGKLAIAPIIGSSSVDKTLQDMQALIDSLK